MENLLCATYLVLYIILFSGLTLQGHRACIYRFVYLIKVFPPLNTSFGKLLLSTRIKWF